MNKPILLLLLLLFNFKKSIFAQCSGNCNDGWGTYTFSDGNEYTGKFENGKMSGQGTYSFSSGQKYIGEFSNDFFHGEGTLIFPNGDRYVGAFQNDKFHGKGTYYFNSGNSKEGLWKNGELTESKSNNNIPTSNNTSYTNNSSVKSYIGWITKTVNFREGPSSGYSIIKTLVPGTSIFIVSNIASNDYYSIIEIESNTEGFVHKSYVEFGDEVKVDEKGILTSSGKSGNSQAGVEIFNDTNVTMTLKLNNINYTFSPKQKKTIYVQPGKYNCRASAPGVRPYISVENLDGYNNYSWKFYIVTQ